MEKLRLLLKHLEPMLKAENDELKKLIPDQEGKDELIDLVDSFETDIAKLLRDQRKYFTKAVSSYTGKAGLSSILAYITTQILPKDPFQSAMEALTGPFLQECLDKLIPIHMEAIDKDVLFEQEISKPTLDWIEEWSPKLAEMMKLSSHDDVEALLAKAQTEGYGIEKIVVEMKDLPAFNRRRARMTAITEVLTANSVSQLESFRQSPAVENKKWLHSGSKKINPRPAHVALDGTVIGIEEFFDVNGYEALYPRDTNLPAKERIACHCALAPAINEDILGLTAEEKQKLREEALAELNKEKKKK